MEETRSAAHLEPQVFLNLIRAEARMMGAVQALLAGAGLSAPQYNVLRILRGAGAGGLACQQIAERMVSRVPDITRLLDRLEKSGLVRRERGSGDRRVVLTRITPAGEDLLAGLDGPVVDLHRRQFSDLSREELLTLNALLRRAGSIRLDHETTVVTSKR